MITVITNGQRITRLQRQFETVLKSTCTTKIKAPTGHRGDGGSAMLLYSPKYDFWYRRVLNDNRYWNAFGLGEPHRHRSNSIVVEMNPPYQDIDRRIAGAFGINEHGEIFLLHRGKIGGGKTGVGKELFFRHFTGYKEAVTDGEFHTTMAVVARMGDKKFLPDVKAFVNEVQRIKDLRAAGEIAAAGDGFLDGNEPTSRKPPKYSGEVVNMFHAKVVRSLMAQLRKKSGDVKRDQLRDVLVFKNGRLHTVFEIKMSTDLSNICKATGQLLLHTPHHEKIRRILLVPRHLHETTQNELRRLGISVKIFDWNDKKKRVEAFYL